MRTLGLSLLLATAATGLRAGEFDPRLVFFREVLPLNRTMESPHERKPETFYSLVVYGSRDGEGFRFFGVDRRFQLEEFKRVLTVFYSTFPPKPKLTVKDIGNNPYPPVPLPNILYQPQGWNEDPYEGAIFVNALCKQYGVALTEWYGGPEIQSKEARFPGVANGFHQACRDFYAARLQAAIKTVDEQKAAEPKPK